MYLEFNYEYIISAFMQNSKYVFGILNNIFGIPNSIYSNYEFG